MTIRFDFYDQSEEHLVRVLEVVPNSPAELAGLQPMTDFLLGTAETVFKGTYWFSPFSLLLTCSHFWGFHTIHIIYHFESFSPSLPLSLPPFPITDPDVLEEILGRNLEQTIDFYVYNTETDTVRTATLMPNLKWGGRGCLGAEIGHGYLHGLPQKCCRSNGTSVFKAPAPHIADATRAVVVENGGGVRGEEEASGGGKERREVNVVDVDLQQKKEQEQQEQQQQSSQPSPPHVVSQEG